MVHSAPHSMSVFDMKNLAIRIHNMSRQQTDAGVDRRHRPEAAENAND